VTARTTNCRGLNTPAKQGEIEMFSSIDKAIVAAVMGLLFIIQTYTGFSLSWISQETVATIVGLLTPVLVWAIPNKKPA
jgi:hypothetical protein